MQKVSGRCGERGVRGRQVPDACGNGQLLEEECLAPDRPVDRHCSVFHSVGFLRGLRLN